MPDLVKLGLALVVFAHGVGHLLFLGPVLGLGNWADQTGDSWIFSAAIGETATRVIATVLWSAVIVLFVAGVAGFLGATEWWRPVTVAAAGLSIVGIIVFWGGIANPSATFALIADIVILGALLVAHWPTTELAGS
jgi:hypothetical protein